MAGDPGGPPLITQKHKNGRLQFAKMYRRKPKSFREKVSYRDETKVERFGKAHLSTGCREQNEANNKKNQYLQSTMGQVLGALTVSKAS